METAPDLSDAALESSIGRAEYSVERGSRSKSSKQAAHRKSARLRIAFFVIASVWGFGAGAAGLAAVLNVSGQPVAFGPKVLAALVPAALLAAAGGWIAAAAYREARDRLRR